MRLASWAVIGGVLLVIGVGWSLYYTYVLYPTATNCPPGALCASLLPFWDQPGLWLGIFVALVGAVVLGMTIAWWQTHLKFDQRQSTTRS